MAVPIRHQNLHDVLDGGVREKLFEEFLVCGCCNENLLFYRKAIDYRQTQDEGKRKIMAKEIWAEFFDEMSPNQVNLPNSGTNRLVTDTLARLNNAEVNLFDNAFQSIDKILSQDSLLRFQCSDSWLNYLAKLELEAIVEKLCEAILRSDAVEISEIIKKINADSKDIINIPNKEGKTALHIAVQKNRSDLLIEIIDSSSSKNLDYFNPLIGTPLHVAICFNYISCVAVLLYYGANTQSKSPKEDIKKGTECEEIFTIFSKQGHRGLQKRFPILFGSSLLGGHSKEESLPNIQVSLNPTKEPAALANLCNELCSACWNNDLATTKTLIQDCDISFFINNFNSRGQTALYCAARQGFVPIVCALVTVPFLDPDVQMLGHLGTSLHAACFYSHLEICAILLYIGASVTLMNAKGLTCRQEALNGSVVALLDTYDHEGVDGIKKSFPGLKKKGRISSHKTRKLSHPEKLVKVSPTAAEKKKESPRTATTEHKSSPTAAEKKKESPRTATTEHKSSPRDKKEDHKSSQRLNPDSPLSGSGSLSSRSGRSSSLPAREQTAKSDLLSEICKSAKELESRMLQSSVSMQAPHPLNDEIYSLLKLINRINSEDAEPT